MRLISKRWGWAMMALGAMTVAGGPMGAAPLAELRWQTLPQLPVSAGQLKQPGVAGPFVGVHGGTLLVAGGANFPEKAPWDGGKKVWWDDIWVLEGLSGGTPRWVTDKTFKLPRRVGYGYSFDAADGVVCVGGHDEERAYADVFLLAWDDRARQVKRTELPAMPRPLTFMAGARIGMKLYVAGGQHGMKGAEAAPTKTFWVLDLAKKDRPEMFKWEELPAWPGPARVHAVAAAQRGGQKAQVVEFFLFSGRRPEAGAPAELLKDAYAFNPRTQTWRTLGPVGGGEGVCVMGATAVAAGSNEVWVFGGDQGAEFKELESHDLAIAGWREKPTATSEAEIESRVAVKLKIYETHPGFSRDVLAYDAATDKWRVAGKSPLPNQVTTQAVRTWDAIIIPTGEVRPGVRTPEVVRIIPEVR